MESYLFMFLKKKCEEQGISMNDLSKASGVPWSTLTRIKHGGNIMNSTCQKLAQALKCSQGDIQAALARTDQVLANNDGIVKKQKSEEQVPEREPEPHCPYDDPVEEPKEMPEKTGQKICVIGQVIPLEEPDCLKENPEMTEVKTIQQLANDVIREEELAATEALPRDNVNHPAHYTQGAVECIDALKASMTREEFIGYLKGCQMKYVWRYRMKGGAEDLRKARWYLDRLIAEVDR